MGVKIILYFLSNYHFCLVLRIYIHRTLHVVFDLSCTCIVHLFVCYILIFIFFSTPLSIKIHTKRLKRLLLSKLYIEVFVVHFFYFIIAIFEETKVYLKGFCHVLGLHINSNIKLSSINRLSWCNLYSGSVYTPSKIDPCTTSAPNSADNDGRMPIKVVATTITQGSVQAI